VILGRGISLERSGSSRQDSWSGGAVGGWIAGAVLAALDVLLTLQQLYYPTDLRGVAEMVLIVAIGYPIVGAMAGLAIGWAASLRAPDHRRGNPAGMALSLIASSSVLLYALSFAYFRMTNSSVALRAGVSAAGLVGCVGVAAGFQRLAANWAPTRIFVFRTLAAWGILLMASLGVVRPSLIRASPAASGPDSRNVVFVTTDTLRADALGCYGNSAAHTPNIDRLAAEGALFLRAQAASSWTLPSHASMFTGLTVPEHGADNALFPLAADRVTVTEMLRSRGFKTSAVVSGVFTSATFGFAKGFDAFDDGITAPWRKLAGASLLRKVARLWPRLNVDLERRAAEVVERAIPFLRDGGPFFLWVHFFDPHADYDPPSPFRPALADGVRPPFDGRGAPLLDVNAGRLAPPGPEDFKRLRALYDGEVSYMDAEIGRMREEIERLGLAKNTAIVLVADHGEAFLEHGRFLHASLYQEVLHVPLIVWAPGIVKPGTRVTAVVRGIDLAPTLVELAGVPWSVDRSQARSILLLADGRDDPPRFARSDRQETTHDGETRLWIESALLVWPWKLYAVPGRQPRLYDLDRDPAEENDLAGRTPNLVKHLQDFLARDGASARAGERHELDPETRSRLRSLGYLQ
jgi:arylsulfatase A-like enzyme